MSTREITFRLRLPRTLGRRAMLTIVAGVAAVGAVAAAAPQAFVANEPLSAAKLNGNFADLDARIARFETSYCGKTTITSGRLDNTNGFAAAAVLCRQVTGCSPTAHMCTMEEMMRAATNGQTVTEKGWIAGGGSPYQCNAFTAEGTEGSTWGPGVLPGVASCGLRLPVFCCH
jgi:hypothetical protein